MSAGLASLSLPWQALNWLRRRVYRESWVTKLEAGRVISVGNLQAGGAGKTPFVAWLARQALARGRSVCILTRGYGGTFRGVLGPGAPAPAAASDETLLLQAQVSGVWIAVGGHRVAAYRGALAAHGKAFDCVILDDGFQHLQVARDVDIVLLTSSGGMLQREFGSEARHATLPVWSKGELVPAGWTPESGVRLEWGYSEDVVRALGEGPVLLVTGVATPREVAALVVRAGGSLFAHVVRPDHAVFEAAEVEAWRARAQRGGARLATTGKDWVKWQLLGVPRGEVLVLEPELRVQGPVGRPGWLDGVLG